MRAYGADSALALKPTIFRLGGSSGTGGDEDGSVYAVQAARRFTYTARLSKSDDTLSLNAPVHAVPLQRDCTRRDVRSRIRRSWLNVICSIIYPGAPRKKVQEYAPESTFL